MNLLSLEETAKELRLSIHTIRAWVFKKRIPVVKLGRRVLVKREDIETLLNENHIEATK